MPSRGLRPNITIAIILFAIVAVGTCGPAQADVTVGTHTALAGWREQFLMQQSRARAQVLAPRPTDPVLLRPNPGLTTEDVATQLSTQLGVTVEAYSKVPGWTTVRVPYGFTTDQVLQQINDSSLAEVASRHGRFYICDAPPQDIPNDEYCVDADPETDYGQYYLFDVNAPEAWYLQHGSPDTTIAIIDSGISIYHEDMGTSDGLSGNIWHNPGEIPNDGIDNDGNLFIDDYWGWDFVGDNIGSAAEAANEATYMPRDDEYPTIWDPAWWQEEYPYSSDPAIGNAEDDNSDGAPDAGVTHGTMVAGIAGAITNNYDDTDPIGGDIAGMAWNCSLMTVRVVNPEGWGWDQDAAAAIRYAADQGADVINMSFSFGLREGFGSYPPIPAATIQMMEEAIQHAISQGCIIVGAAGNSGDATGYPGGIDFPADMTEVISVGAVDWTGERSVYSNYAASGDVLDIVAPGDLMFTISTIDMSTWAWLELLLPGEYELGDDLLDFAFGGTSFSAPIVSGFAGLLKSRYPGITYQQFREYIQNSADDLGHSVPHIEYGYGRLDAYNAILYADAHIPEPATITMMLLGLGGLAGYRRLRRKS